MVKQALFSIIFLSSTIISAMDCSGGDGSYFPHYSSMCDEKKELEQGNYLYKTVDMAALTAAHKKIARHCPWNTKKSCEESLNHVLGTLAIKAPRLRADDLSDCYHGCLKHKDKKQFDTCVCDTKNHLIETYVRKEGVVDRDHMNACSILLQSFIDTNEKHN